MSRHGSVGPAGSSVDASPASLRSHIVIVGLPGTGKSSLAAPLARRLGRSTRDTDRLVQHRAGKSIPELFSNIGEASFRRIESQALLEALSGPSAVIATGGGIVLDAGNRRLLRDRATVVWLTADVEALADRLKDSAEVRPLLSGDALSELQRLQEERDPLYRQVADVVVDTNGLDRSAVLDATLDALRADGEQERRSGVAP